MTTFIGQIDELDTKPVAYESPNAVYQGIGYDKDGKPIYKKLDGKGSPFKLATSLSLDDEGKEFLSQMFEFTGLFNSRASGKVGFYHTLSKGERQELVIAYTQNKLLDPTSKKVAPLVDKYRSVLQPSVNQLGLFVSSPQNVPQTVVLDKDTGITLVSLIFPIMPKPAEDIFNIDVKNAINVVQRNIKVPISQRNFNALVGMAFLMNESTFIASDGVQSLNSGVYNELPTLMLRQVDENFNSEVYGYFYNLVKYYSLVRIFSLDFS